MLSEISQTEKEIPYDLTGIYNLKKKKKTLIDTQNRKWLPEAGLASQL